MSEVQLLRLVLVFGSLVLVSTGLAGKRLSWSQGIRMGLIWLGIFLIVTLFITMVAG